MKITKYISANILSIFGLFLSFLLLLLTVEGTIHVGTNDITGLSLIDNSFYYLVFILFLIFLLPIEILLNKIKFNNKYLLNINITDKDCLLIYNVMFWLGIISAITYSVIVLYVYIILYIR